VSQPGPGRSPLFFLCIVALLRTLSLWRHVEGVRKKVGKLTAHQGKFRDYFVRGDKVTSLLSTITSQRGCFGRGGIRQWGIIFRILHGPEGKRKQNLDRRSKKGVGNSNPLSTLLWRIRKKSTPKKSKKASGKKVRGTTRLVNDRLESWDRTSQVGAKNTVREGFPVYLYGDTEAKKGEPTGAAYNKGVPKGSEALGNFEWGTEKNGSQKLVV